MRHALSAAAERLGGELAGEHDQPVERVLRERGYEPDEGQPGVTLLRKCPFHAVAQRHPEVVCEMNRALLAGLVENTEWKAVLEPAPGRCCVALRRR
jgi:predicted ArsR family transcriptional regulator